MRELSSLSQTESCHKSLRRMWQLLKLEMSSQMMKMPGDFHSLRERLVDFHSCHLTMMRQEPNRREHLPEDSRRMMSLRMKRTGQSMSLNFLEDCHSWRSWRRRRRLGLYTKLKHLVGYHSLKSWQRRVLNMSQRKPVDYCSLTSLKRAVGFHSSISLQMKKLVLNTSLSLFEDCHS